MTKLWWILPIAMLTLSGCSFPGSGSSTSDVSMGAFLKSTDGGETFSPKVKIDDKTSIASYDILSLAFGAEDTRTMFIGTMNNGIFTTTDGAENWKQLNYPPVKVYGLVTDTKNLQRIFATGEYQGRGKIYRSDNAGQDWKEIYTEPQDGTIVTALAESRGEGALYAGTSAGVVIKSVDGGETWRNISVGSDIFGQSPILSIATGTQAGGTVYFVAKGRGIFLTTDGGQTMTDLREPMREVLAGGTVYSLAVDPSRPGVVYVGTDRGLLRGDNNGRTWTALNVIESSKKYQVRAVAVNPKNSNEIMYSSAMAVYKSVDGGNSWSTYQLTGEKAVSILSYDSFDPSTVYLGLRAE